MRLTEHRRHLMALVALTRIAQIWLHVGYTRASIKEPDWMPEPTTWFDGAMYGIRTRDHWNHNPVLYQLS